MENEKWGKDLAENLIRLRKNQGLTQAELGEKLNYSDKSVSKWERGEGVPDLNVMMRLCEMYNVSLNELVGLAEKKDENVKTSDHIINHTYLLVTMTSAVWLLALISFFVMLFAVPEMTNKWLAFIYALPVTFLCMGTSFLCWRNYAWAMGSLSAMLWTTCIAIELSVNPVYSAVIYTVGGLVQLTAVMVVGIMIYERRRKRVKQNEGKETEKAT